MKHAIKFFAMMAVAAMFATTFTSCSKDDDPIAVSGITLDKQTLVLKITESEQLTATVLPAGAANNTIEWTSSDPAKATVINGLVTAVAVGDVDIIAKAGNQTATCRVTCIAIITQFEGAWDSSEGYTLVASSNNYSITDTPTGTVDVEKGTFTDSGSALSMHKTSSLGSPVNENYTLPYTLYAPAYATIDEITYLKRNAFVGTWENNTLIPNRLIFQDATNFLYEMIDTSEGITRLKGTFTYTTTKLTLQYTGKWNESAGTWDPYVQNLPLSFTGISWTEINVTDGVGSPYYGVYKKK
jgi:hypothetical protein